VNLFLPALHELARIYDRQINRGSLWLARRKLAKAETDLGLLGWQQADFEGEAQRHVKQLTHVEEEQARQTNESAALGLAIREGKDKREAGRKEYEAARATLEAAWAEAAEPVEAAERQLATRRKGDVDFPKMIADLDREQAEVEELKGRLMVAPSMTPQMHTELMRLRERAVMITNAKSDLRIRESQSAHDIRTLEETLTEARPRLAEATKALQALDGQFARADGTLERQIAQRTRTKADIEAKIDDLEKAKNNPYRQIGQILADHDIAPLNQPQALTEVKHRRAVIVSLAKALARSIETTGLQDARALRLSWLLWGAILLLVIGVVIYFG
jgi:DNA repair exonuclease SbcCD ATPase subunit